MRTWHAAALVAAALVTAPTVSAADGVTLESALTPRTHLFGDPVDAEVRIVVPASSADSVHLEPSFAPYRLAAPVVVDRIEGGDSTEVRWRWRLECLTRACLPGQTARRFAFRPTRIRFKLDGHSQSLEVRWPPLLVRSRLASNDGAFRASISPLGDPTTRIDPARLQLLVWGGAAALGLVAAILLAPLVLRLPLPRRGFERLGPMERALVLVRRAAKRGDSSRRRTALERLGRELAQRDRPELAGEAGRLAWAEAAPSGPALDEFAQRAERSLGEQP